MITDTLQNIFNIPDLRKRVLFMLAMLAIYRVGAFIPTPGIDFNALEQFFAENQGTVFGFLDMFSGGNFRRLTIFALGIMPYITASIILQLLTVVWPFLEKLSKEGELGRRKITTYTRYLTIVLSAVQSGGIAIALQRGEQSFVLDPGLRFVLMTMLTLTTGTAFIMWLGEQITERGIGNGMSLIIFAGIVVGLPSAIGELYIKVNTNEWSVLTLIILFFRDDRRHRLYRSGRTRTATHHGSVREAGRRTPRHGWPIDAPSAEGQHRRRDPGDFRIVDSDVSADVRAVSERKPVHAGSQRRIELR